jgi:hypothetical protein
MILQARLIRYRDAPGYLGMDRNRFDAEVRPTITEIPIGERGIAFDRLDLDAWVDDYKSRNGRPSRNRGALTCDQGQRVFKPQRAARKLSTSNTGAVEFSHASAPSAKMMQKPGSGKSKTGSMSNWNKALDACSAMQRNGTS